MEFSPQDYNSSTGEKSSRHFYIFPCFMIIAETMRISKLWVLSFGIVNSIIYKYMMDTKF